jgi:hypothetical protein
MRLLIFGLFLLGGCGSPCQQVKATRCLGDVVEICGSNSKWQKVMICSQVTSISSKAPKKWVCGQTTTGHTCVPSPGGN